MHPLAKDEDSCHRDFCTEHFESLGSVIIPNPVSLVFGLGITPWLLVLGYYTASLVPSHPARFFINCLFIELSLNYLISVVGTQVENKILECDNTT